MVARNTVVCGRGEKESGGWYGGCMFCGADPFEAFAPFPGQMWNSLPPPFHVAVGVPKCPTSVAFYGISCIQTLSLSCPREHFAAQSADVGPKAAASLRCPRQHVAGASVRPGARCFTSKIWPFLSSAYVTTRRRPWPGHPFKACCSLFRATTCSCEHRRIQAHAAVTSQAIAAIACPIALPVCSHAVPPDLLVLHKLS